MNTAVSKIRELIKPSTTANRIHPLSMGANHDGMHSAAKRNAIARPNSHQVPVPLQMKGIKNNTENAAAMTSPNCFGEELDRSIGEASLRFQLACKCPKPPCVATYPKRRL